MNQITLTSLALLIARLTLGVVLFAHGAQKVSAGSAAMASAALPATFKKRWALPLFWLMPASLRNSSPAFFCSSALQPDWLRLLLSHKCSRPFIFRIARTDFS